MQVRIPSLAAWIKLQPWADTLLPVLAFLTSGIYICASLLSKIAGKTLWQRLTREVDSWSASDKPPDGCYGLDTLANELFPQLEAPAQSLNFVGRKVEQQRLSNQCALAKAAGGIRVVALWGPQGIGKTHLSYVFAQAVSSGNYADLSHWKSYRLDKGYDPQVLMDGLPPKPVLLLLDDVSLADDATHKRLHTVLQIGIACKVPALLLLTTWQPRMGEGLARNQLLIDDELEIKPLQDLFARQLFENADQLPVALRGHPLMLRLLGQQALHAGVDASTTDL